MNFTTKIPVQKSNQPINYSSKIVLLGSCFAESMGEKFEYFKFKNKVNPFGIIFNPNSIEKLVFRILNDHKFTEKDLFFHNEHWHCFDTHSDLCDQDKDSFLHKLNSILDLSAQKLTEATHIIITYGTSWVYKLKSSSKIVANCHKVPQNQFEKELLSIEAIQKSIQNTVNPIRKINPNCNFIFTISPVRHIKDGFIENQRSKSHLIAAVHSSGFEFSTYSYFPSYEIIMDELRDYRFYAEDLLHPNQTAINYIWEQFFLSQIDIEMYPVMEQVCSIQKSLLHRPFHPDSKSHQKFIENLNQKINTLAAQFPQIQF